MFLSLNPVPFQWHVCYKVTQVLLEDMWRFLPQSYAVYSPSPPTFSKPIYCRLATTRQEKEQRIYPALSTSTHSGSTVPNSPRAEVTVHFHVLVPLTQGFLQPLSRGDRIGKEITCKHFFCGSGRWTTSTAALMRPWVTASTTASSYQNTEPTVPCPPLA